MTALETPVGRRQVLKGFLIAGPTLAVAARLGFADGASAFPTKTDEVPDQQDFTGPGPGLRGYPGPLAEHLV